MKAITIRWEFTPGDPARVLYYVDDSVVGEGDDGFDRILDVVRAHKNIRVTLKLERLSSLGGSSLVESLPFSERFDELKEALGENKLIYDFF